jgi:hypothetical protein
VTGNNQTWATDGHDVALAENISRRWLSEICCRTSESGGAQFKSLEAARFNSKASDMPDVLSAPSGVNNDAEKNFVG